MYVCMYVCMYVNIYVCMNLCIFNFSFSFSVRFYGACALSKIDGRAVSAHIAAATASEGRNVPLAIVLALRPSLAWTEGVKRLQEYPIVRHLLVALEREGVVSDVKGDDRL